MRFVYAILAREIARVKIGFTTNLRERLIALRRESGLTLEVLAIAPAGSRGRPKERAIHERLRAHRVAGEWFHDCAPVRIVVQEMQGEYRDWMSRRKQPAAHLLDAR